MEGNLALSFIILLWAGGQDQLGYHNLWRLTLYHVIQHRRGLSLCLSDNKILFINMVNNFLIDFLTLNDLNLRLWRLRRRNMFRLRFQLWQCL